MKFHPVPSLSGYYVTSNGNIYSFWQRGRHAGQYQVSEPRQLKIWKDQDGYPCVTVRKCGVPTRRTVHSMILEALVGPRPIGCVARHLDDDKTNNHVDNLAWGTPKQNSEDMIKNGHSLRGEKARRSKLTESDIKQIRVLYANHIPRKDIAVKYGISPTHVWLIGTYQSWKHI